MYFRGSYLHSGFRQSNSCSQVLSHKHVRIVCLSEDHLKLVELIGGEGGTISLCLGAGRALSLDDAALVALRRRWRI